MRRRHNLTRKADLVPVVEALKVEYGLGCRTIGHLLGYSARYIADIVRDFEMPPARHNALLHKVVELMPPPLCDKVRAINARSFAARQESTGQRLPAATAPLCTINHVDETEESCVNAIGEETHAQRKRKAA